MSVVEVEFETGEERPSSFFFVDEHGSPVAGPFANLEAAGAMLVCIRARRAGPSARGAQPAPSAEDTARFRELWKVAEAGRGRVRLWTGHVEGRRWIRGQRVYDDFAGLAPEWRSKIETAIDPVPRATPREVAERDSEGAEVSPPTGGPR